MKLLVIALICSKITIIDPNYKLTTYIKKNPPNVRKIMKIADIEDSTYIKIIGNNNNTEKHNLKQLINESIDELNPYDNVEVFEAIHEYLNDLMPMADNYVFDDSHTEIIYKGIKRLRLNKEKYDKVGFILFNYIFNKINFTNIKEKTTLFEQVLERHQMKGFLMHELILNLAYAFYVRYPIKDWTKSIPTILKAFYDEDFIDNEFLFDWFDNKLNDFLRGHRLFMKENNDKLKAASKVFVEWLKSEEKDTN